MAASIDPSIIWASKPRRRSSRLARIAALTASCRATTIPSTSIRYSNINAVGGPTSSASLASPASAAASATANHSTQNEDEPTQ